MAAWFHLEHHSDLYEAYVSHRNHVHIMGNNRFLMFLLHSHKKNTLLEGEKDYLSLIEKDSISTPHSVQNFTLSDISLPQLGQNLGIKFN